MSGYVEILSASTATDMMRLLPTELITKILERLPVQDLVRCRLVSHCHVWHVTVLSERSMLPNRLVANFGTS